MGYDQELGKALYDALVELWDNGSLESAPRSYSGRAMYGDRCIGIDLSSSSDLFGLGVDVGRVVEQEIPGPRMDSMGRGVIAYWPGLKWQAEFEEKE